MKNVTKNLALLAITLTLPLSVLAGAEGRGGGDPCENRIKIVRDDIRSWIESGGPSNGLKLPSNLTLEEYSQKMVQALETAKIKCVKKGDVGYPVQVDNVPKVCSFDVSKNQSQITCDYNSFLNSTGEDGQYVLIHHEYAGIAGLEQPNGSSSSYVISNQLTRYLENQTIRKLALKPKPVVQNHCNIEVSLTDSVKMKFCQIPSASGVLIGSENGDGDERPVKPRNFRAFQMGQFEVTQAQFKAVMGFEPWKGKAVVRESDNNPAVYVTYFEAQQFADILNHLDPTATYRLPTEAEWEYAARARTQTNYYWGDEFNGNHVYYISNTYGQNRYYAHDVTTCPNKLLDSKKPGYCANGFGLMHMLGNVLEWTEDAYTSDYSNAPADGNIAVKGAAGSARVIRGGSWRSGAQHLRSANRFAYGQSDRDYYVGFRLLRMPK